MDSSLLNRCVRLLCRLQSGVPCSTAEFARESGVSRRTVYRDLRRLQEAGVVIRYDRASGRHAVGSHLKSPTSVLSDDELVLLLLAAGTSVISLNPRFREAIGHIIRSLLTRVPEALQARVFSLLDAMTIEPFPVLCLKRHESVWLRMVTAIRERRCVRVTLRPSAADGQPRETSLAPYRLVAAENGWYVVGRSSSDNNVCRLDLMHIQHAALTEEEYEVPSEYRGGLRK